MVRLIKILKSLSLLKGWLFSVIGVAIIGFAIWIMVDSKSVTSEGIELLVIGLILSGVNNETISHIRGGSDTPDKP